MTALAQEALPILTGVFEHLACYLQSGRERSAWRAAMLATALAESRELPAELRERLLALADGLEARLPKASIEPTAPIGLSPSRPGPGSGQGRCRAMDAACCEWAIEPGRFDAGYWGTAAHLRERGM